MANVKVFTLSGVLIAVISLLPPSPVVAQERAVAADVFNPAERGSEWFAADSLDLRGQARPSVGLVGSWSYRPLVLRDDEDAVEHSVVRNQFVLHFGASLVLINRVRLGLNVPFQAFADGRSVSIGNSTWSAPASESSVGDARLAIDARLYGEYGGPLTVAAGLQLLLPTGDRDSYAGDGVTRIIPQLMVAGEIASLVYAARLGVGIRPSTTAFAETYAGSYLALALAAGIRVLDRRLVLGPELLAHAVFVKGQLFDKDSTPTEVLLGTHYTFASAVRLGASFGLGLTGAFRSPQHRVNVSLEWTY